MIKKSWLKLKRMRSKSIQDFGSQWELYNTNEGYHESIDLFIDIIKPLMTLEDFDGKKVAEVGSGNGRIIEMVSQTKALSIYAIEPSNGYKLIRNKFLKSSERIKIINEAGDSFSIIEELDIILSIGVLHHIPEPDPVLVNCFKSLKKGGMIFVWLYGREGNSIYLLLISVLRPITTKIPDNLLKKFVDFIYLPLSLYIRLCRLIKLPMRNYMLNVIGKMNAESQKQIVFDQLNPIYSKYYTKKEVFDLLERNGFKDIKVNRRHGYSFNATAIKN